MQKQKLAINPGLNLLGMVRAGKTLLWVDDKLSEENQCIAMMAQDLDVTIKRASTTAEAISTFEALGEAKFYPQSHLRIMSNMTRTESGETNPDAGLDLAKELRTRGYLGPILIFCGNYDRAKQVIAKAHLITITSDPTVAIEYACFQQVRWNAVFEDCSGLKVDAAHVCSQQGLNDLYPNFDALKREGIEHRDVPLEGTSQTAYTKYYITPTMYSAGKNRDQAAKHRMRIPLLLPSMISVRCIRTGDTTEAARILFMVEELLFRYIDPAKVTIAPTWKPMLALRGGGWVCKDLLNPKP